MHDLSEYSVLVNETFYRCEHILDYIEKHPDVDGLEKEAIMATIMDALVTRKAIDKDKDFLDWENKRIDNNPEHYHYEEKPNICGIPLQVKDELRRHTIQISAGVPITMFIAKPPSKQTRYCVYDPNYAVSAIFPEATFYEVFYTSPTRGVRIESARPFVEVTINGEKYLVDTLTKRIIKSAFFKEHFGFEIISEISTTNFTAEQQRIYDELTEPHRGLDFFLSFVKHMHFEEIPGMAEMLYEIERSKEMYPEEWQKMYEFEEEMSHMYIDGSFLRRRENK